MERAVYFNGTKYIIKYDDADNWLTTARLILARDGFGTLRVMTMPEKYSVAKLISGLKHTSYKNGDTLDLRRCNLCTPNYSRHKETDNKSGHKYICAYKGKYYVRIYYNGKVIDGGGYFLLADAIKKRDKILKKLQNVLDKKSNMELE